VWRAGVIKCQVKCSDHIVAQQANRYIVAFHIAISYDTQRPPYNGRAVGLPPTRCMCGLIWRTTVRADQCTAACETHWMRHVSRRRRARLMFDIQGHWQCAAETGHDGVFTGSTRRRIGLTWAGAWWPGLVSRYTDSYAPSSRQISGSGHWTGAAVLISTTRYDEHSGPFCMHSLAHHWRNCRPCCPHPSLPIRCMVVYPGNVRQRAMDRTVCMASDINQTQTPPLRYVSSARTRRAFVHDIVGYMAATISYTRRICEWYRDIV